MKTEEKKVLERGKRRWANYRWTNAMVDELFRLQNGKCGVCGEPLGNTFNIDHEHFLIKTAKRQKWHGFAVFKDHSCTAILVADTKKQLIEDIKNVALPLSVRGLLHSGRMGCNRRLGRVDDPKWLRNAANYLENPPSKKILDKTQII